LDERFAFSLGFLIVNSQSKIVNSKGLMKMEMIMMSINESWIWLGPMLVVCFGVVLIAQIIDIFNDER